MYATIDLIRLCDNLTQHRLERWINQGWIAPYKDTTEKVFNDLDRTRADLICYLLDDLEIQEDAMPVILSLLDQVYSLRGELRNLAGAVARQPAGVRSEISIALGAHNKRET